MELLMIYIIQQDKGQDVFMDIGLKNKKIIENNK